ncbi:hypothetical protein KKC44_02400 [Patescibacteria group bacterium]|nr:hypothetical protein [Patescibacteria group bacterium]
MMTTLHLTADEKKTFEKLPAQLQEGWTVEEETIDAYETPEVLTMRMKMADFKKYPEVETLVERMKDAKDIREVDLSGIQEGVLKEFAFTIGAKGLAAIIRFLLKETKTDADVQGLAGLSLMRHEILDTNASITNT